MAYFGLSDPYIAKLDVETEKYSDGFKNGTAVGTTITPQYNEASIYGDNIEQESVRELRYADVTAETTHMPLQAANTIFGHTVDDTTKKIIYSADDNANYVGYGFYAAEKINNKVSYVAAILPKVLFSEAEDSYTTKGESIELRGASITGRATQLKNGEWKVKQTFDTKEEAIAFIKEYLNITA